MIRFWKCLHCGSTWPLTDTSCGNCGSGELEMVEVDFSEFDQAFDQRGQTVLSQINVVVRGDYGSKA